MFRYPPLCWWLILYRGADVLMGYVEKRAQNLRHVGFADYRTGNRPTHIWTHVSRPVKNFNSDGVEIERGGAVGEVE